MQTAVSNSFQSLSRSYHRQRTTANEASSWPNPWTTIKKIHTHYLFYFRTVQWTLIPRRTYEFWWQNKIFAEALKIVQIASDNKVVHFGSDIATTQEEVKAILYVVRNCFIIKSTAKDTLACSLNYFAHWVVNNKHFRTLAFKVANYIW